MIFECKRGARFARDSRVCGTTKKVREWKSEKRTERYQAREGETHEVEEERLIPSLFCHSIAARTFSPAQVEHLRGILLPDLS